MRRLLAALILTAAGCASAGPAGPTLPLTLTFKISDYEETGGLLPITGILELVIEPSGEASASTRRQILRDVTRSDPLNHEQLTELVARVEAWSSKAKEQAALPPKYHGVLAYGAKKVAWQKEEKLPPELQELVSFLLKIPPTLRVDQRGGPKPH